MIPQRTIAKPIRHNTRAQTLEQTHNPMRQSSNETELFVEFYFETIATSSTAGLITDDADCGTR